MPQPWDFDETAIVGDAGLGFLFGGLYKCNLAPAGVLRAGQLGFLGMAGLSGLGELQAGHTATGMFDLVTAFVPLLFKRACFTAKTPLLTPTGSKPIALIRAGELVLARDESDLNGAVEAKLVEEVFTNYARIWELRVSGRVIRTTSEHPFYAEGKGWTAAGELEVGDRLAGVERGSWVSVESVGDGGAWETVYNVRVADYHTYFVGDIDWGFAVWAHNVCNRWNEFTREASRFYRAYRANGGRRTTTPRQFYRDILPRDRRRHILFGDVDPRGHAGGGHHTAGGTVRITAKLNRRNRYGAYTANVEIYQGRRIWVPKRRISTMFPDSWSQGRVMTEIYSAYLRRARVPGTYNAWVGRSRSGMRIRMFIDPRTGRIISAFPVRGIS